MEGNACAVGRTHLGISWMRSLWKGAFRRVGILILAGCLQAGAVGANRDGSKMTHWAFQPVRMPAVPAVRDGGWVRNDVDRFVLARLEERGLRPVGPATKAAWLRRVTFDLIGLPPTPEEGAAFEGDASPEAYQHVVERLLASTHYGERWGRHWMDVVRYADTAGDNADYPVPEVYRYRDYIIDAFNADKPYDRFVREQLAGDILAERGDGKYAEGIVATGFLALSRRYGTGPYELWHLTLENTIETVGQAFLGLNLKCARCHDHKFDPVTMQDYYGLYGIFSSAEFPWAGSEEIQSKNFNRQKFVPLVPASEAAPKIQVWEGRKRQLREAIEALEKEKDTGAEGGSGADRKQRIEALRKELRAIEKPGAPGDLPVAYAVREGRVSDAALQKRGEPGQAGPVVPRCVPGFLAGDEAVRFPADASGRDEFARWLTRPQNPLTARVMVNRIWQHHFGEGLVTTPNNFGTRSEKPIHAALLDYLAVRFVESGWSVKAMHRLLLDSAVYRLSSEAGTGQGEVDPANRLHWRLDRRRLDAESLRDAMLSVSGELDPASPGPHPFPAAEKWTWTQHTPFKERYETRHRSVYLMTQRFQRHPFLALFDGPDTNTSTEARRTSVVPQQALFVMNHPWVDAQARGLARRVLGVRGEDRARLERLLDLAWGRSLSEGEARRWLRWLDAARSAAAAAGVAGGWDCEWEAWTVMARVAMQSNEFLYVD